MMEPNACCVNCGRMLTTRATWSCAVENAGARLLGRLHDEGQVMNDEATNAQVGAIGMEGTGAKAPC